MESLILCLVAGAEIEEGMGRWKEKGREVDQRKNENRSCLILKE